MCQYCGFDGTRRLEDFLQLEGDHLIPRTIAGEDAEDELNRVTACHYCNTVKRAFDPAHGKFTKVATLELRRKLIEVAAAEIRKSKERIWKKQGGLDNVFQLLVNS